MFIGCMALICSCSDDKSGSEGLRHDAEILYSFTVQGRSGIVFNSRIGQDTIILKVSPYLDAVAELDSVSPKFYLSNGATVSPDPSIPQNFAQDGGVKYTVTSGDGKVQHVYTVTYGPSNQLPYGSGFSYAEVGAKKDFTELGYPGEVNNFGLTELEYGDLNMYVAYCGNYIVLLSRAYIDYDSTLPYCIKVVDKDKLNDAGTLNTGSIVMQNIRCITSDYKGTLVALVSHDNTTSFYYWKKPTDMPTEVGSINVNMAPASDASNNFQVAGDITGKAWITSLAPRDSHGTHYRIAVNDGKLASNYTTVISGYSSSDVNGWQMISPLDDSDQPSFVVGDVEGTANVANSVHVYINNAGGATTTVMPGLWQNRLQTWWVGTGCALFRGGAHTPVVTALPINGKTYVALTSGTSWYHTAAVLDTDLETLAHENLNIAEVVNRAWSYGEWLDWYWSSEENCAYLAVWFSRIGLRTYKLTCYE